MGPSNLVRDMTKKKPNTVNLHNLFSGVQSIMEATLRTQENVEHPVTHGDSTELNWSGLLETYLPKRYKVDRAQVLDSRGKLSESIDIVIYDRQYSPNLFSLNESLYVPAESVYAVIEVKPELNKKYLKYAGEKAASVRRLYRTSAPILHAGGKYEARKPFRIISGIVAQKSRWKPAYGRSFISVLASLDKDEQVDFGCTLDSGAFEATYHKNGKPTVRISEHNDSLITFLFDLLSALQKLGTAPAIEFSEYEKSLQD
jgi:hypothetical protein